MELVRGEPLSTHIARGPIRPDETAASSRRPPGRCRPPTSAASCTAVQSPANRVCTDGKVKLTDFGFAKAADAVPVTAPGWSWAPRTTSRPNRPAAPRPARGRRVLAGHRRLRVPGRAPAVPRRERGRGGDDAGPRPAPADAGEGTDPARELIEATLVKDPTLRYSTGGEFAAAVAASARRGDADAGRAGTGWPRRSAHRVTGWTRQSNARLSDQPPGPPPGSPRHRRTSIRKGAAGGGHPGARRS